MATIVDVARAAGVSVSTVSHVINGTRHVNADTAERVREAIHQVHFTPSTVARALKTSTTNSVGIAMSAFSNPYFSDIILAIERECAHLGLMPFLCDTADTPEEELRVVRALHQRRVDGIILAPSPDPSEAALTFIEEHGIPCVLVDRTPAPRFDQVGVENERGTEAMVTHLIGHGHRRIGYVAGQKGFTTAEERVRGYRSALDAARIGFDAALLVAATADTQEAAAAADRLLSLPEPPTAIATGNNMATIGAIAAIEARGLRVPDDVALVGFDDFEWADFFEPRLTVVAQPCQDIGRQAAKLLTARITEPSRPPETVRLAPQLVVRNSCGCTMPRHARPGIGGFRLRSGGAAEDEA